MADQTDPNAQFINLVLDCLEKGMFPAAAKKQPSEARRNEVTEIALSQVGRLLEIAVLMKEIPNPQKNLPYEKAFYFGAPLILGMEIYMIQLIAGGPNDQNQLEFIALTVHLLDVEFIPIEKAS